MFEKYIVIKESNIIAKQTSNGIWYCSELPAKNVKELDALIGEVNAVLNRYNKNGEGNKKPSPPTKVKGLK
jgi:hypothetical protein